MQPFKPLPKLSSDPTGVQRTRNVARRVVGRLPGFLGARYPAAFSGEGAVPDTEAEAPTQVSFAAFVTTAGGAPKELKVTAKPALNAGEAHAFTLTDRQGLKLDVRVEGELKAVLESCSSSRSPLWQFTRAKPRAPWQARSVLSRSIFHRGEGTTITYDAETQSARRQTTTGRNATERGR